MKTNIFKVGLTIILTCLTISINATDWLFHGGKSKYQIVISTEASTSEKTAARELQQYIEQISGAQLPVTSDPKTSANRILVGYSEQVAALTGTQKPETDDEGFTYRTIGHDLLIWGGSQRGTMYGVFTFLEKELGIHWLTPKCAIVPKLKQWKLPRLNHSERPFIKYRYSNYFVAKDVPEWSAHTRENMKWDYSKNDYGNLETYWGAHTMGYFVPTNEFYSNHPEYFCLRDGKRYGGYGQLCLSNPEVLELCKTRLAQFMRENPDHRIYSLSQNDNYLFCQCGKCAAIEQQYGGHSGLIVWFVNQVADAIRDEFPDKYVGTFAYQYSRQPPKGIKPRENVVIRLCSIECCFAHPLDAGCPQNEAFMRDLQGWAELAPHLFIWDYIVDYAQYIAPWPNFQVLGPNIEIFGRNNAIGIFEEAQYQSAGAEFDEMKAWTVNQLLWNPRQDVDSLVNIFTDGFYGKAAPYIMDYYRLCQSMVKPDVHYGIYIREDHEIYSDAFTEKAFAILRDAEGAAETDEIRERVSRVRMQPLYLHCMRHKAKSLKDGTWDELVRLMSRYDAKPNEAVRREDFIRDFEKAAKTVARTKWMNPLEQGDGIVHGRWWNGELRDNYHRMTPRAEGKVRGSVWNLSKQSAGLSVRFHTNAPSVKVRYKVKGSLSMFHMPTTGVSGIDLYATDRDGTLRWCASKFNLSYKDTINYEFKDLTYFTGEDHGYDFELFLPLYNEVTWMEIGVPEDRELHFLPVSGEKPIVVYGTSIGQGACASRPGMAWTNIVHRESGFPVINLSFSGNGLIEEEVFSFLTEIDAKLFVIDCLPNMATERTELIYDRLLRGVAILREKSKAPILLVEHNYANSISSQQNIDWQTRSNGEQRRAYEALQQQGVKNIYYLNREEMQFTQDSMVEGIHPNDLGMRQYADAYLRKIRELFPR